MNGNQAKTTVVGTRMPEPILALLRRIAKREDRSVSYIILRCIRKALPKMEREAK
jgi:hypothetical protein